MTWEKPVEMESLDFGSPGQERQDYDWLSYYPVKKEEGLTETIANLVQTHFQMREANKTAAALEDDENTDSGDEDTNLLVEDDISNGVDPGLTSITNINGVDNLNSEEELLAALFNSGSPNKQNEPLFFHKPSISIVKPSYQTTTTTTTATTTTTTVAPSYSYNNTGYGGYPVVVSSMIEIKVKLSCLVLYCQLY